MRLKLASRKSDLARWQAVQVARALERLPAKPAIEYLFKASLGDQNLDVPLASMGSKGVFTEDFYEDLVSGLCDLVVHSWKDLPVEERARTHIVSTLKRADVRDILLVPQEVWEGAQASGRLRVLTSSPRRVYNLSAILPALLPGKPKIEFNNVRGNVPTRLGKMRDQNSALVLAKAGLDRLLEAEQEGFLAQEEPLRSLIQNCRFVVLPLSLNPPAPAQGALAIEAARASETVNALCASVCDELTFSCVQREREVLRRYGGGCHQKIGVAVLPRDYGTVYVLRGLTDSGEHLNEFRIENSTPWGRAQTRDQVFPLEPTMNRWFVRRNLRVSEDLSAKDALFIARAEALPPEYHPHEKQVVWTAGVRSWVKLARRGVWVHGCDEGLGESEDPRLDWLAGPLNWCKLTHSQSSTTRGRTPLSAGAPLAERAGGGGERGAVATYELIPEEQAPDLRNKTHFYWMSRTAFERAKQLFPKEVTEGYNGCGPGLTHQFLQAQTGLKNRVKVFAGLEQFLSESLPA
ncbi:MAG: hydroxymethylbilane synthase [Bdellovibrionales bacterium]